MKKNLRLHTAAFKAQVALEALKGNQTLSMLAFRMMLIGS